MSIYEKLEEELKESFAYTLYEKLIFITGFLVDDDENEDLLNFVNYLLYSEKDFTITPKLDFSELQTWSTVNQWQHDNPLPEKTFVDYLHEQFDKTEQSYRKVNRPFCKTCIHYDDDNLLFGSSCINCKYYSQSNNSDNYEKVN